MDIYSICCICNMFLLGVMVTIIAFALRDKKEK
jgi:hypothetical protein